MINDTEIRVGNWIQNEIGRPIRVESIFGQRFNIEFNQGQMGNSPLTEMVGISINIDLIEACGFKQIDAVNSDGDDIVGWYIKINKDENLWLNYKLQPHFYGWEFLPYELRYLHQLQNLYYSLTGKELNVTLSEPLVK